MTARNDNLRTVLALALLALVALLLSGCGTQTDVRIGTKSQAKTVTKEVIRETPLANAEEGWHRAPPPKAGA